MSREKKVFDLLLCDDFVCIKKGAGITWKIQIGQREWWGPLAVVIDQAYSEMYETRTEKVTP